MPSRINHFAPDLKLVGDFYSPDGAIVSGTIEGSLLLGGQLEIDRTGTIRGGEVEATSLKIQPGGMIKALLKIAPKETTVSRSSKSSAPHSPTTPGWKNLNILNWGKK